MKTTIKLSLVTLALLGLAACGSGSGGSASTSEPVKNDKTPAVVNKGEKPNNSTNSGDEPKQKVPKFSKVASTVTSSVDDIPTRNTKFIIFNKDFGKNDIELDLFPKYELSQEKWEESFEVGDDKENEKGFWRVYNQTYSAVMGSGETYRFGVGQQQFTDPERDFDIETITGLNTQEKDLPAAMVATYKGVAFDINEQGKLHYQVDFGKKEGFGEITGLSKYGKITLEKGTIGNLSKNSKDLEDYFSENQMGITGLAKAEKSPEYAAITGRPAVRDVVRAYDLQFFGPKAEEIGGIVRTEDQYIENGSSRDEYLDANIGFGGKR